MDKNLKPPLAPYPDWSRFLTAVWKHGRCRGVIPRELITKHAYRAHDAIIESFTREGTDPQVRPSSFVACAQQTYYIAKEEVPEPMPAEIPMTFAMGHVLHEVSFAAIEAALPEGFSCEIEKEVTLPGWWPSDHPKFRDKGHIDLILHVDDWNLAKEYLDIDECDSILVDLKSMGGYSWREHRKKHFGYEPDGFGYLTQLAIYTDAVGLQEQGALLAGINRDVLMSPLAPRRVPGKVLAKELERIKVAVNGAVKGTPAGPEFIERWGDDASFFCGTNGRKGYCPFKLACAKYRKENS